MKVVSRIVLLVIGLSPIAAISACAASDATDEFENYRRILHQEYPEYDTTPLTYSTTLYDTEDFVFDDLLVGDFNDDSVNDFAAILSRVRSAEEAKADKNRRARHLRLVRAVVVCSSVSTPHNLTATSPYECTYLAEPRVGGVTGELAFVEISPDRINDERLSKGSHCRESAENRFGLRTISIVEFKGYCNTYFYPDEESGYNDCTYCRD